MMMMEPTPAAAMTLPAEVREKLAELELELSEGKLGSLAVVSVASENGQEISSPAVSCLIMCHAIMSVIGPCDGSSKRPVLTSIIKSTV